MRTTSLLITLMSVMVVVFAGVALAKVIEGDNNDNRLVGTPHDDTIYGKGGNDIINARDGDDVIYAVDRSQDLIACGGGFDRVRANPGDAISRHPEHICEKVIRKGMEVHGPG
jgi:hypothetical protein